MSARNRIDIDRTVHPREPKTTLRQLSGGYVVGDAGSDGVENDRSFATPAWNTEIDRVQPIRSADIVIGTSMNPGNKTRISG